MGFADSPLALMAGSAMRAYSSLSFEFTSVCLAARATKGRAAVWEASGTGGLRARRRHLALQTLIRDSEYLGAGYGGAAARVPRDGPHRGVAGAQKSAG